MRRTACLIPFGISNPRNDRVLFPCAFRQSGTGWLFEIEIQSSLVKPAPTKATKSIGLCGANSRKEAFSRTVAVIEFNERVGSHGVQEFVLYSSV